MISPEPAKRTIAQISDLHFGRHNSEIMEDLLSSIDQSHPDLVALSGDFTQRAKHSEFAQARRFLDRISYPKLVVPGNHDVPLYNLFDRFIRPFKKYDRYVAPVGQPRSFFRDDELAVLGLNTARRFTRKNGRVSHAQIAHILDAFSAVPDAIFKVIVTHHPFGFPTGQAPLEVAGRSRIALQAITKAGVHLLLSGHHHRAQSGGSAQIAGEGTVLIVHAGTAISTRTRCPEGNTYNLIQIVRNRVSVTVMDWTEGRGFLENQIKHYLYGSNRWQPI